MVSLRKKRSKILNDGGTRRSARLIALEEHKSEKAANPMIPVDLAQTSTRKRGRRKKVIEVYEEENEQEFDRTNDVATSSNNPFGVQNPNDRIIEQILDMMEVKDTKELFSMPDEFQEIDYMEGVRKPGDFATLRQKHKDGMYSALEEFETDVYMVFQKAFESNHEDSVPYKEAVSLQDQAKQVFQSLRNNRTYAELELATWHQKIFPSKKRATRSDANARNSVSTPQPNNSAPLTINDGMKQSNAIVESASKGKAQSSKGNQVLKRTPQPKARSRSRITRGYAERSKSPQDQRRRTYEDGSNSTTDPVLAIAKQPVQLTYNKNAPSYKESLLRFVENAGPAAKMIAKMKCLEHDQLSLPSYARPYIETGKASPYNIGSGSVISNFLPNSSHLFSNPSVPGSSSKVDIRYMSSNMCDDPIYYSSSDTIDGYGTTPSCELETNRLVRLFTPHDESQPSEEGEKSLLGSSSTQSAVPRESFNFSPLRTGEPSMKSFSSVAKEAQPSGFSPLRMGEPSMKGFSSVAKEAQPSGFSPLRMGEPSMKGFSSVAKEAQPSGRVQPKPNSIYDLQLAQPGSSEPRKMTRFGPQGLAAKGAQSGIVLGFSQFAHSSQPFKPGTLDPFAKLS